MKLFINLAVILVFSISILAQGKVETINVQAKDLDLKNVKLGNVTYLVYTKKSKQAPAENLYISNIKVESVKHNGKDAYAITQSWEATGDTPRHTAYTVLNAADGSTLWHKTFWARTGLTMTFDFENKKMTSEGTPTEQFKPQAEAFLKKSETDFQNSFAAYNLNWHSDLVIFPMLAYKENRVFKINFFDAGASESQIAVYTVKGSETIKGSAGEAIDCWLIEHRPEKFEGYQRFWISKKTKELLKEEDFFNNSYRFKIKLKTSAND